MTGFGWGATLVLGYEKNGQMGEVFVRREGAALYTAEEWTGHAVPDWTFEEDGRLYFCGEDFATMMGQCSLRTLGQPRLRLDDVLSALSRGARTVSALARALGRDVQEVDRSLRTLERLAKVRQRGDGQVELR